MKRFLLALCAILSAGLAQAATDSLAVQKACFTTAKAELEGMLDGTQPLNYERAIFLIENAYWGNVLNEGKYTTYLDKCTSYIQQIIDGNKDKIRDNYQPNTLERASQSPEDRRKSNQALLTNWAIHAFMQDSIIWYRQGKILQVTAHTPFSYSYADPLGTNNWQNTQVIHLLAEYKGNCFALASLYKILADRLHAEASLCTAPNHIYITHKDEIGRPYNVELSNGSFPGSGTISTLTHTSNDALMNDIALRELTSKQAVTLCLVYLAKGYQYRFGIKNDDFMLACADRALQYDTKSLNAMLLKAEILESRLLAENKSVRALQTNKTFITYQALLQRLCSLGYTEMPLQMKNMLVKGWTRDTLIYLFRQSIDPPAHNTTAGIPDTRYASLSWGLFDEEIQTLPIERYGRALFDTKKQKIVGFAKEEVLYNDYNFDPVAFAWQVDPLAHQFPSQSPYSAFNNNPIFFVDPDGRSGIAYWEGEGNKRTLVIKADYHYIEGTIAKNILSGAKAEYGSFKNVNYGGEQVRARFDINFIPEKPGTDLSVYTGADGQNRLVNSSIDKENELENSYFAEVQLDVNKISTRTYSNPNDPSKPLSLKANEKLDMAISALAHGIGHNIGLVHNDEGIMQDQVTTTFQVPGFDVLNRPKSDYFLEYKPNHVSKANVNALLSRIPSMTELKNEYWKGQPNADGQRDNGITILK